MLRSGPTRSLLRAINASATPTLRSNPASPVNALRHSKLSTVARRPQVLTALKPLAPKTLALVRYNSDRKNVDQIDTKAEAELAQHKLQPDPAGVSMDSTVRHVRDEVGAKEEQHEDAEMLAGVKQDLQTIRDTFSLEGVPREAYYVGMAGVLPYLATSVSTVYCAYEIRHAADTGSGIFLTERTAELLLHIIEPLQVGYGAVIISFLGAIHWGLEWAKYGGTKGYPRYAIGVVSTALAWPTILMPVEYALISQFLVFNFLYYSDSRATKRGWAPQWYAVYRFVLTFVVGSAIVVSLIGRGQIADRIGQMPGTADRVRMFREAQQEDIAEEEGARAKFLSEDEDEEEEEEEEGGEEEEKEGDDDEKEGEDEE